MTPQMRDKLVQELLRRGFTDDGNQGIAAPRGTMTFGVEYLSEATVGDFFETMVARQEKVFRSVEVVGREAATDSYEDVRIVVEALKSLLRDL